ncbi:MAG TPA: transglutaminase-like domain-containing protein [Candidatus Dojkabacteria bacterium]|nr:transglutaminase-like domain-containing protein [Candidatus Dojkabacteria bacterium]
MRNLLGCFHKILYLFSILFLNFVFLQPINSVFAQEDLSIKSTFHHNWDGERLDTTIYLTLSTESASTVVTYLTVTIPQTEINPEIFSINRDKVLEHTTHKGRESTDLVIDLEKSPLYKDKPITLKITYFQSLTGSTISLLSKLNNIETNEFLFTYPSSIGEISWSSATILNQEDKGGNVKITTEIPNTDFVKIAFGEQITYSFDINKTLSNSSDTTIYSEVTLPINNSYQNIVISSINPLPDKAYKDIDGNYILQYSIVSQSAIDIKISGFIYMNKQDSNDSKEYIIEQNPLWKISNTSLIRHINRYVNTYGLNISDTFSDINELKPEEREIFYESIYHYVLEYLQPNVNSVGSLSGAERIGSEDILVKQGMSSNEEYADSIIALYRYYKIPARFVIGYLSNISNYDSEGIYHYWAEFYDQDKKDWVIVEPFFEDYSKTPLWSKEMKDHITLIYRYSNPFNPKLSFFSPQDFTLKLVEQAPVYTNKAKIDLVLSPFNISDPYLSGVINIKNNGNTILDSFTFKKSKPEISEYIDYIGNNQKILILPNQEYEIKFNIPFKEVEEDFFVVMDINSGVNTIKDIYVKKEIELVKSYSDLDIFSKLLSILIYIVSLAGIFFVYKKVK